MELIIAVWQSPYPVFKLIMIGIPIAIIILIVIEAMKGGNQ